MPTYELTCHDCGERFDRFLMRLIRDEDKVCPICGSNNVKTGVGGGFLGTGTHGSSAGTSCGTGGFT